jgi:hypothetical protein
MKVKLYSKEELVKHSKVLINSLDSRGHLTSYARRMIKDIWLEYYLNQTNHKEVKSFLYSSLRSLNVQNTLIDSIWEYCTGDDIRDFSELDGSYDEED